MTEYEKIIGYMKQNGSITKMDAYRNGISTTLAQRIADLRRKGYKIGRVMVTPENSQKSAYARYFLA